MLTVAGYQQDYSQEPFLKFVSVQMRVCKQIGEFHDLCRKFEKGI